MTPTAARPPISRTSLPAVGIGPEVAVADEEDDEQRCEHAPQVELALVGLAEDEKDEECVE